MVVSLHDITVGDDIELKRILASVGFDGDLVKALLRKPQLAEAWVASLREQLNPPTPTFEHLFRSPQDIFDAFEVRARERNWPISKQQIDELWASFAGRTHKSSLDSVLTLDIWLGDLPTTFEELWSWNKDVHVRTWRYDGLKSGKKQLRLFNAKQYDNRPSVKWGVLDVTTNRGQAPKDVRDANSTGTTVLAASALHPAWVPAMDYDTVLGVWLPGLQATLPGGDPWSVVPLLLWGRLGRSVDFDADWGVYRGSAFAVPVFREL